jgi:hypothetical protein
VKGICSCGRLMFRYWNPIEKILGNQNSKEQSNLIGIKINFKEIPVEL